LDSTITTHG